MVEKGTEFIVGDYNDKTNFDPEDILISHEVIVKGTAFKSNKFVVKDHNENCLVVGQIKKVGIHKSSAVYFITEVCQAVRQPCINAYVPAPVQEAYYCVNQVDLIAYYPLPKYSVCGMSSFCPHILVLVIHQWWNKGHPPEDFAQPY